MVKSLRNVKPLSQASSLKTILSKPQPKKIEERFGRNLGISGKVHFETDADFADYVRNVTVRRFLKFLDYDYNWMDLLDCSSGKTPKTQTCIYPKLGCFAIICEAFIFENCD